MGQSKENVNDILYILAQIQYFSSKSLKEIMSHIKINRMDGLCSLPHPKGIGMLICGYDAYQRFDILAKRFLSSQKDKAVNTHLPEYSKALRAEFVRRFLKELEPVNQKNVDRMLSTAYRCISREFDSITHYIPCSIFFSNDPAEFDVGPVHFLHKSKFKELYGDEIESQRTILMRKHQEQCQLAICSGMPAESVATTEQSDKLAEDFVDKLNNFFNSFDWVAVVKIGESDITISRNKASLVIEAALSILKLLLSQRFTDKLRTAYNPGSSTHTVNLYRSSDNSLNISYSSGYDGNILGDNWFQYLIEKGGYFLNTAARTLLSIVNPQNTFHLSQRFQDALAWYGDAVSEKSPAAQVVKYVSAIERMTGTGIEYDKDGNVRRGVTEIVTCRVSILCSNATEEDYAYWMSEVDSIYECRSNLVHGTISPFDDSVSAMSYKAEQISRLVLLTGLDFFNSLGLEDPQYNQRSLEKAYLNLEASYTFGPKEQ